MATQTQDTVFEAMTAEELNTLIGRRHDAALADAAWEWARRTVHPTETTPQTDPKARLVAAMSRLAYWQDATQQRLHGQNNLPSDLISDQYLAACDAYMDASQAISGQSWS